MRSNKFFIFSCLIFLSSCVIHESTKEQSCLFPKEKLEKGGLINRLINKDNLEDSYEKFICRDFSNYRLVYPISYSSKKKFMIMGEDIILSKKEFRESRISIKDSKFNKVSKENLKRINSERDIYARKILQNHQKNIKILGLIFLQKGSFQVSMG